MHPPKDTAKIDYFTGHGSRKKSEEAAQKAALDQAVDQIVHSLGRKGYPLTESEKKWWLTTAFRLPGGASIVDQWVRTYQESPERPYIHRSSLYLLVAVPKVFMEHFIDTLVQEDRRALADMDSEFELSKGAMRGLDGVAFLIHLRRSREKSRIIHSLLSFPVEDRRRILQKQVAVDALWRKSLREIDLRMISSVPSFYLTNDGRKLPVLREQARLTRKDHRAGISALSLLLSIHPGTVSESLVFPPLSWLFGNSRPVLSRSSVDWEIHLLRPTLTPSRLAFRYRCQPTDPHGTGQCTILSAWIPAENGYLEGYYQPVFGSRLDNAFFRSLLSKTLLEEHFIFYRKRVLHPILISFENLPSDQKESVWKTVVNQGKSLGFNFCHQDDKGTSPVCSMIIPDEGSPSSLPLLRIIVEGYRANEENRKGVRITTVNIRVREELSDDQSLSWIKKSGAKSLRFTKDAARQSAWKEIGRKLSKDLDLFYYRTQEQHTGEAFYER
jgi:hypothetical protein